MIHHNHINKHNFQENVRYDYAFITPNIEQLLERWSTFCKYPPD